MQIKVQAEIIAESIDEFWIDPRNSGVDIDTMKVLANIENMMRYVWDTKYPYLLLDEYEFKVIQNYL